MDGYSNSSHSLTGSLTKLTWNLAEGNIQKAKRMMIGKEAAYFLPPKRKREEERDVYVLKKDLEQIDATESCSIGAICIVSALLKRILRV